MSIQWFPGHIARARREIRENLKLVDIVIEILDARCPNASINFLDADIKNKKRLIILNKCDLADPKKNSYYVNYIINRYKDDKVEVILLDSRNNNIKRMVDKYIDKLAEDIIARNEMKGIKNTLLKAMVVGMPNVGKSTFINSYVKKKVNNVADIAGVTKNMSWTKLSDKVLLLDTPGVTVPKFSSDMVGRNLALIGSINDDIVEKQDLMFNFVNDMKKEYFDLFKARYRLNVTDDKSDTILIINEIAENTKCIKKGGEIDYNKVTNLIITDFRKGAIGRITLENINR